MFVFHTSKKSLKGKPMATLKSYSDLNKIANPLKEGHKSKSVKNKWLQDLKDTFKKVTPLPLLSSTYSYDKLVEIYILIANKID